MDTEDILILNARVIDELGNVVTTDNTTKVFFEVEAGGAELIGENPSTSKAGIASILIKMSGDETPLLISGKNNLLGKYSQSLNP